MWWLHVFKEQLYFGGQYCSAAPWRLRHISDLPLVRLGGKRIVYILMIKIFKDSNGLIIGIPTQSAGIEPGALGNWHPNGSTRRRKKPQECCSVFWEDQSSAAKGCESDFLFLFKKSGLICKERTCTQRLFYLSSHWAGVSPDLSIAAERAYKSELAVDKYPSPDNAALFSAHLGTPDASFQRQMGERRRVGRALLWGWAKKILRQFKDCAQLCSKPVVKQNVTLKYGASGVLWAHLTTLCEDR